MSFPGPLAATCGQVTKFQTGAYQQKYCPGLLGAFFNKGAVSHAQQSSYTMETGLRRQNNGLVGASVLDDLGDAISAWTMLPDSLCVRDINVHLV